MYGRPVGIGVEASDEGGVGAKLGRSAAKLARMAEKDSGTAVDGLNDPSDLDVGVAIASELADLVMILPEADDREAAAIVGSVRRADIKEARTVGKLDHIIDVRGDADVFVQHLAGLVGRDARSLAGKGHSRKYR